MNRPRSEQGSLPLVMIAAIVLAGVVAVLTSQVLLGERTARFDRDHAQAIHVADAGLQAAFVDLSTTEAEGEVSADEAIGEGGFSWQARPRQDSPETWDVRSVGTFRGATRYVEAVVGPQLQHNLALFAERECRIPGGGSTEFLTYDQDGFHAGAPIQVGTNDGECVTLGFSEEKKKTIELVCFGDTPCDKRLDTRPQVYPDLAAIAFDTGGVCADRTALPLVVPKGGSRTLTSAESPYCVSSLEVGRGGNLTVDGPVEIFVQPGGSFLISAQGAGNKALINLTAHQLASTPPNPLPEPINLQIHLSGGAVDFGNSHAEIAAAIYAPNSSCSFRAQGTLYGAAVCRSVETQGGLSVLYDTRLADLAIDGTFAIRGWWEEYAGTTSWPAVE